MNGAPVKLLDMPQPQEASALSRTRWRMPWATAGIAAIAAVGMLVMLYPSTASWVSQYNQSQTVVDLHKVVGGEPLAKLAAELESAHAYNTALITGALGDGAELSPASNIPTSDASVPSGFDYNQLLRVSDDGLMARLRVPSINLDLPIYHGTADSTLLKGVGHLEGSSLPVGGISQHSVLTAHRGLPESTLFNNLDQVKIGDTFTIEVFNEVLTYKVIKTQTVLPDESKALLPEYGNDLVTLVTCTPLGLNTHRYLVTGERILPTPVKDIANAGAQPDIPGFPWWVLGVGCVLGTYVLVIIFAGRPTSPQREVQLPD